MTKTTRPPNATEQEAVIKFEEDIKALGEWRTRMNQLTKLLEEMSK